MPSEQIAILTWLAITIGLVLWILIFNPRDFAGQPYAASNHMMGAVVVGMFWPVGLVVLPFVGLAAALSKRHGDKIQTQPDAAALEEKQLAINVLGKDYFD